jgi:hypothetical protein
VSWIDHVEVTIEKMSNVRLWSDASHLPPGPYQLTNSTYPYDAYAASPVAPFFQMQQQLACNASKANLAGSSMPVTRWVGIASIKAEIEAAIRACSLFPFISDSS